ncbi:MAG: DUF4982 domain-containing protein [Clostridia bacterium]|nr:DUF4982 domain-containing protein [Clostridia bacterium]
MINEFNNGWILEKDGKSTVVVDLPHDAMLDEKRYENCVNGKQCAYFSGGKYVYRKVLNISKAELNYYTALLFEGVYRYATINLNGKTVGTNTNGFSDFTVELTGQLVEGENVIEVIADNTLTPNCRWYTGSGIYRSVQLIQKVKNEIQNVRITTLSVNPAKINIEVKSLSQPQVEIYDGDILLYKGEKGVIELDNVKLWNTESPYLYRCVVTTENDSEEVKFGIRTVQVVSKQGLFINGEKTLLRGGCIHSDNGILGACSFKQAEYRKVRILKQAGYNAIRCAHNPCSRYFLQACDELGMYVLDETFDGWYIPKEYHDYSRDFYSDYEYTLARMVEKDFNHPCVIMYSIGNEVSETAEDKGVALCGKMRDYVKSLDCMRPVTCGINLLIDVYAQLGFGIYKDKGEYKKVPLPDKTKKNKEKKSGSTFFNSMMQKLGGLMFFMSKLKRAERIAKKVADNIDIVGLNYGSSRYEIDGKKYPERLMLGTETMVKDLPYNWSKVKSTDGLIGDFVWAAWDYLGEAGVGDWTYYSYKGLPLLAGSGTIDLEGNITAESEFMQRVWGLKKEPFIGVRPLNHANEVPFKSAWRFTDCISSWNWQGYEGNKATIEVYADAHFVELFLNGKKVGCKTIKDFKAIFNVKYASGTLKAIAYDKQKRNLSESSLVSGKTVMLTAVADKTKISSNELTYLQIKFVDENGNVVPYVEQKVEIELVGDSVSLQGFGSAQVKTDEVFNKPYHNSFRGSCLAALRAGIVKGKTKIIIKTKNFATQEITIEVE